MSATEEEQPRPSAEIVAAQVEIKQRAEEAKLRKEGKQTGKKDKEEGALNKAIAKELDPYIDRNALRFRFD